MTTTRPIFLASAFLCLIALVGLTRIFDSLPPQAIGVSIDVVTIAILILYRFRSSFRERLELLQLEELICWHAIRAPIGAAFLVMSQEGLLPSLFATRAGYGDIAIAIAGLVAVGLALHLENSKLKTRLFILWNVLGLLDLLFAVGTGLFLGVTNPGSMDWIARLPLLLVPTFIVPLLLSTHVIMLYRLVGVSRRPKAGTG